MILLTLDIFDEDLNIFHWVIGSILTEYQCTEFEILIKLYNFRSQAFCFQFHSKLLSFLLNRLLFHCRNLSFYRGNLRFSRSSALYLYSLISFYLFHATVIMSFSTFLLKLLRILLQILVHNFQITCLKKEKYLLHLLLFNWWLFLRLVPADFKDLGGDLFYWQFLNYCIAKNFIFLNFIIQIHHFLINEWIEPFQTFFIILKFKFF